MTTSNQGRTKRGTSALLSNKKNYRAGAPKLASLMKIRHAYAFLFRVMRDHSMYTKHSTFALFLALEIPRINHLSLCLQNNSPKKKSFMHQISSLSGSDFIAIFQKLGLTNPESDVKFDVSLFFVFHQYLVSGNIQTYFSILEIIRASFWCKLQRCRCNGNRDMRGKRR